ncbi:hypothetical protein ACHAW5_009244 [Stephanodiscus triporus]|uniref:Uncharacterized protein n=1 Tax=Stephanodiscus triporus TaxID=2934178 RepID=A0ABD3NKL6_9STRA
MRRVSSCYFSIASSIVDGGNNNNSSGGGGGCNLSSDSSTLISHAGGGDEGAGAFDDFLLHDVLMGVLSYLDARSLASFSETARRPNFECFYFLELQLQRALLMGDCHDRGGGGGGFEDDDDDDNDDNNDDNNDAEDGEDYRPSRDGGDGDGRRRRGRRRPPDDGAVAGGRTTTIVPSFDGSIAGTGVVSRLARLDGAAARDVVQSYLDSNASMRAMPLRHSLAYFRQMLSGCHHHHPSSSMHIPENMAKGARNMALLFTLLGAAYRVHQGGSVDGGVASMTHGGGMMPDPSAVLSEENVEAIKNVMIKVGLAGGFLKAGMTTMKEKKAETAANAAATTAAARVDAASPADGMDVARREEGAVDGVHQLRDDRSSRTDVLADAVSGLTHVDDGGGLTFSTEQSSQRRQQGRSVSIGSIEDLSNRIPNPAAIASMLYNAFSNGSIVATGSRYAPVAAANLGVLSSNKEEGDRPNPDDPRAMMPTQGGDTHREGATSPKMRHRSKRSHKILRQSDDIHEEKELLLGSSSEGSKILSLAEAVDGSGVAEEPMSDEQDLDELLLPEAASHATERSSSPNPHDNPSSAILDAAENDRGNNPTTTFFSFSSAENDSMSSSLDSGNVPTGCIGAYAAAVKTAATEVTRLVKEERRANFEKLSPEDQHDLGVRFIDACTSDDRLDVVKDILQVQRRMDVDRFFVGPDDTETCALHAAAFNGAEKVLRFLCGGIDERDPNLDCGLCDVNVKDANGWTALHFAAGANSVTSVRVLADHGAKLTLEASNGYTPFHWAERLSNEEVAAELERLGADNRFVGRWMFGGLAPPNGDDRRIPFVSFLANRFFAFGR